MFGLGIGLLYVGGWLHLAGMELKVLVLYMFFALTAYIGLSRIVAEMGFAVCEYFGYGAEFRAYLYFGVACDFSAFYGESGVYLRAVRHDAWVSRSASGADAEVDERVEVSAQSLDRRDCDCIGVGFFVSIGDTVYTAYRHGGYNLGGLTRVAGVRNNYQRAVTWIRNLQPPDWDRLTFAGSGMVIVLLLTFLRYNFIWWPLPAVGLALQGMYMARRLVFPVFMVWVYKSLILKFGGVGMYRRGQPFFIGLMVGYAFAVFFSTLIDHIFFYGHGHVVHDF